MLYRPEELFAGYSAEEVEKLFFLRKGLGDLPGDERQRLLGKLNSVGFAAIRLDTVHLLLCVMHDARIKDQNRFLSEVFLPWIGLRGQTKPHFGRVASELVRIGEFEPGSVQEAAHAANVYRNIVSDLFDPYLSLVVACYQFVEGNFTGLEVADLGQGERNKYEYLAARVDHLYAGKPTFLSGYDPRVRNAVSHAGAAGVTYLPGRVVFKSIKRGSPPTVETVLWTNNELQHRVLLLLECIQSIEAAIEVFGLDVGEVIRDDFTTYSQFVLHAITPEQRAALRQRHDETMQRVHQADGLTVEEKTAALMSLLRHNLDLRQMPFRGVRLRDDRKVLCIDVPAKAFAAAEDAEVFHRACELPRYAIVARGIFGQMFDPILVAETDESGGRGHLTASFTGKDLDDYAEERAGLVDLLNEGRWWLDGQRVEFKVDFEAVARAEMSQAAPPFPRRPRT